MFHDSRNDKSSFDTIRVLETIKNTTKLLKELKIVSIDFYLNPNDEKFINIKEQLQCIYSQLLPNSVTGRLDIISIKTKFFTDSNFLDYKISSKEQIIDENILNCELLLLKLAKKELSDLVNQNDSSSNTIIKVLEKIISDYFVKESLFDTINVFKEAEKAFINFLDDQLVLTNAILIKTSIRNCPFRVSIEKQTAICNGAILILEAIDQEALAKFFHTFFAASEIRIFNRSGMTLKFKKDSLITTPEITIDRSLLGDNWKLLYEKFKRQI